MSPWLDIATLEKMKHADGRFVAVSAANLPFLLRSGMQVHLVPPRIDVLRQLTVASVTEERASSAVISFVEALSADQAQELVGCHCVVARQSVEDEVGDAVRTCSALSAGLQGWMVYDEQAGRIGQILDFVEHPTQITLSVDTLAGPKLVPLVDELVVSFDEDARVITMRLPAGLLEV